MAQKQKWQERVFGKQLISCGSLTKAGAYELLPTGDVLQNSETLGLYFSFANMQCDDFLEKLKDLYGRLEGAKGDGGKRLEVVQVVLWAHNDVYGDFETGHRDSLLNLPWFAVPFDEIDLKTRLSRRYRIKSGVPTLVLLDRDGGTISAAAQEKLLEDPTGASFPWRPRPVEQVLKDVVLQPGGAFFKERPADNKEITYGDLPGGVKGFYFSAHWCPPCKAFTPQLAEVYNVIRKRENFEIVFVSSDRSPDSFHLYVESMPWLCIPWQQAAVRAELAELYGIRGIPTLLLLDSNGHVITMDARTEIAEDPSGHHFPWKPRPVNVLTERFATKLHEYPAIVLFVDTEETEVQFAENVLSPAAELYYKKHNINFNNLQEDYHEEDHYLQFLVATDSEAGDALRDLIGLDDVVPLLVGVDIPNRKYVIMEYGLEINVETVCQFVEKYQSGGLTFRNIDREDS